jgi:hypothetical protein
MSSGRQQTGILDPWSFQTGTYFKKKIDAQITFNYEFQNGFYR